MGMKVWINKIHIGKGVHSKTGLLSGNAFGIYIDFTDPNSAMVYFKPLNDSFPESALKVKEGILLNFERELIEEDDIEYALDVMHLFNSSSQLPLSSAKHILSVKKVIGMLQQEYHNADASYIMLKTLLKLLMLNLIRIGKEGFLTQDIQQKRVFQFLELMETSFLKEAQPLYYAKEMGISNKRLNQILKDKLGLTAKQIIQQRLITEAKRRLVKSEITIKELVYELGFDSNSSFSRFFKKWAGESPSTFRSKHQK